MNRELEKDLARKILKYQFRQKMENNGSVPEIKSKLMLDFYKYALNHFIESLEDIPNKYQEIFAE
jgi:hypothetical protein